MKNTPCLTPESEVDVYYYEPDPFPPGSKPTKNYVVAMLDKRPTEWVIPRGTMARRMTVQAFRDALDRASLPARIFDDCYLQAVSQNGYYEVIIDRLLDI
jgi:hypothetical protein